MRTIKCTNSTSPNILIHSPQVPLAGLRPSLRAEMGRASLRDRGEYLIEYNNKLFLVHKMKPT